MATSGVVIPAALKPPEGYETATPCEEAVPSIEPNSEQQAISANDTTKASQSATESNQPEVHAGFPKKDVLAPDQIEDLLAKLISGVSEKEAALLKEKLSSATEEVAGKLMAEIARIESVGDRTDQELHLMCLLADFPSTVVLQFFQSELAKQLALPEQNRHFLAEGVAIYGLMRNPDPTSLTLLQRVIETRYMGRSQAMQAIARIDSPGADCLLAAYYANSEMRDSALLAMGESPHRHRFESYIVDAAFSSDRMTRRIAWHYLAALRTVSAVSTLRQAAQQEPDELSRSLAARYLYEATDGKEGNKPSE